jgi:putative membrane protein
VLLVKRLFIVILLLLVLIFGVLFSLQNTATVPLDLLVIQFSEARITFWIIWAFIIGGVLGVLVSAVVILRLKSRLLIAQRQLKKRDLELNKLRNSELRTALDLPSKTLNSSRSNKY